ncbi:hypothetical protein I5Q34_04890 [Streptomyces sp. AV19]|uniref:hypothetical protein n=1 Tax=Streptomyces sp. AV19 TaxID=2793068 RepID=UPI0018FEF3E9|nr:hypothetical protein [Streptomyces sp. AV19]MBH1933635.1 hypothetical protein [Streptomyces sp. AV19]MDG4535859.1 hypothetical protein [Streptomyces sp. AV19]
MSAQHHEHPPELIPRPEKTFPALRTALARVAPSRLAEFQADRDLAFTSATRHNSFRPIHLFQVKWATEIEIERLPHLAARYRTALDAANTLDRDDPKWREAMDDCLAVREEARAAVADG